MNHANWTILLLALSVSSGVFAEQQSHDQQHEEHEEHRDHDDHEFKLIELDERQIKAGGIETVQVKRGHHPGIVSAPGEVVLNAYRTSKVTPRIDAQITRRHARLGQPVVQGQPLVTLSSVEMAEAQGGLLVADREWKRSRKLGRKVISERRYLEAEVARQQAWAKVVAYGMTESQIEALLKEGDVSRAAGSFELLSPQQGTVISDDFIVGEVAESGRVLFSITDESTLWVDARLTPDDAALVEVGASADISIGDHLLSGQVIQSHHSLDESTRTLSVHIEVPNPNDQLHPGQFVTATIQSKNGTEGIAVPVDAVLRSADGDWQVFVETAPGRYKAREIEVQHDTRDSVIVAGLKEGVRIVSKGAFFIQSEIAKGGFDIHNH
ncbi:MAG: efflux RND transporter periplasmic adaptor subunit [Thiogranum sp.]